LIEDVQFLNIIKHNYSYDPTQKKWFFSFEHISKLIGEKFFENKPKVDLKVGIKISYFIKENIYENNLNLFLKKSIQLFEYADEINDYSLFKKLNEVIKQVKIQFKFKNKFKSFQICFKPRNSSIRFYK